MWNISKKVLFVIMLLSAITGGISLNLVDWDSLKIEQNYIKELQTPIILFVLSIIFMVKYVKKLKSNS